MEVSVGLQPELNERQRCSIYVSAGGVDINFTPELSDGPHKVTRVEVMAAAALIGIARTLTGRGEAEVTNMLAAFDAAQKRRKR